MKISSFAFASIVALVAGCAAETAPTPEGEVGRTQEAFCAGGVIEPPNFPPIDLPAPGTQDEVTGLQNLGTGTYNNACSTQYVIGLEKILHRRYAVDVHPHVAVSKLECEGTYAESFIEGYTQPFLGPNGFVPGGWSVAKPLTVVHGTWNVNRCDFNSYYTMPAAPYIRARLVISAWAPSGKPLEGTTFIYGL